MHAKLDKFIPHLDGKLAIAYLSKGDVSHGVVCTPIFPADVLPAHDGVYWTRFVDFMGDENVGYARFERVESLGGGAWTAQHNEPEGAAADETLTSSRYEWLGLTVNPDHLYPYTPSDAAPETPVQTTSVEDDEL